MLMTSTKTLNTVDASTFNSAQMGYRYLKVARWYGVMDGLLRATFAYPWVNFRHIISPSSELATVNLPLVSKPPIELISLELDRRAGAGRH